MKNELINTRTMATIFAIALATTHGNARQGEPDDSCGSGGRVITALGSGNDSGAAVAVQADGKMLVVGTSNNGTQNVFALARYNSDGSLDNAFGTGGKVTTAVGSRNDSAQSVAVQSDGKIVVAGYSDRGTAGSPNDDFALVRYNANGSLDTGFGSGGKVITSIGSGLDDAYSVAVQEDGRIVVAGTTFNGSKDDFALVRYTATGALDTSFGANGKVTTAIGSRDDFGRSVALQDDGKIVVGGHSSLSPTQDAFALARYHGDGSLDASFNTTGKATTSIGSGLDDAYGVAVQRDGKIVLAGRSQNGSRGRFAAARYTVSGALDTGFGSGGKVITSIGSVDDSAASVAVQRDGKILLGGYSDDGAGHDFAVVRYRGDGSLDDAFNHGGKVTTRGGHGAGMAVQRDGKVIVAGYSGNGSNDDFSLVRYQGDRSRDIDGDGKADIVFQNHAGQMVAWYMDDHGGAKSSDYIYGGGLGDWKVVACADVNSDGFADFIFQNSVGQIYVWLLDGTGHGVDFSTGSGLKPGSHYLYGGGLGDWRIVACADVNGDGLQDLIFQNSVGQIYTWYLDGTGDDVNFSTGSGLKPGSHFLYSGGLADWRVVACDDVNGDGTPDLMFQHTTGQIYVWSLDGTGNGVDFSTGSGLRTGSRFLYGGGLGDWKIKSTADINGDGTYDILFQNNAGQVAVWYMDDHGGASSAFLYAGGLGDWNIR
ncbi:MAG: FG-GAP-like repeat-containing protein [Chthoniobacteraceae bacterium]